MIGVTSGLVRPCGFLSNNVLLDGFSVAIASEPSVSINRLSHNICVALSGVVFGCVLWVRRTEQNDDGGRVFVVVCSRGNSVQ